MQTPENRSTNEHQWLKISFFCPLALLEPATDLMGVLSGSGVEQSPETEDGATISGFFQLFDATDQGPEDTATDIRTRVQGEITALFAHYGLVPNTMHSTYLAHQDWATSWKQYFTPFAIVPGLVIKPSWTNYQPASGEAVIEMDPGMAFGTGQHASTSMAVALIKNSIERIRPPVMLDVGTGTGILAMAAILFGASAVIALDNDPDAVTVALDNIAHNQLSEVIIVSRNPIDEILGRFQLISANIEHDVLIEMATQLTRLAAPGGHLVLSGLLKGDQEENIKVVYSALGWQMLDQQYQDEWAALQLLRL